MIHRRLVLAAGAATWGNAVLPSQAQTPERVWRVAVMGLGSQTLMDGWPPWQAFLAELTRLGYVRGKNLVLERRFAGSDVARLDGLATELVALNPDVIFDHAGAAGVRAALKQTKTIPIVMALVGDPVVANLVSSLGRPGGNVTGNAFHAVDLAAKRVQILCEAIGKPAHIALLRSRVSRGSAFADQYEASLTAVAKAAGSRMQVVDAANIDELPALFERMSRDGVEALAIDMSPFTDFANPQISALVAQHRLPAIANGRSFAEQGLLLTYTVDFVEPFRRAANHIDKILRGAKPADIPVEVASKYELTVNTTTAKALGISIPRALLLRADEVFT